MFHPYHSRRRVEPRDSARRLGPGLETLVAWLLLSACAILATAKAHASAANFQKGSYVPIFEWPGDVQTLVGDVNKRVLDIRSQRQWKTEWTPNLKDNVHMTINNKLLDRKDKTGHESHYFGDGEKAELDQLIAARAGGLETMLANATNKENWLDFDGLHFTYDTSAAVGEEAELYLEIELGPQDQKRISRITGIASNSWHITVGHFMAQRTDTRDEIDSKLSHLKVLATDDDMIALLRSRKPPEVVTLKRIRIVRTDNVNAQYPVYREFSATRRRQRDRRPS